jgi:hypothetical protein
MGEGSRVEAKVVADAAEIGGSYKGELNVRSLILLDKGRAEGVLDAKTLAVREGAQINGSINAGQAAAGGHAHTAAPPAGGILGRVILRDLAASLAAPSGGTAASRSGGSRGSTIRALATSPSWPTRATCRAWPPPGPRRSSWPPR